MLSRIPLPPRPAIGIRARLALLIFAVTAIAVSVVYLSVVPQLKVNLRDDRLKELRASAERDSQVLQVATGFNTPADQFRVLVQNASTESGHRVTLVGIPLPTPAGEAGGGPYVVADSTNLEQALDTKFTVAMRASRAGKTVTGVELVGNTEYAQAAKPLFQGGRVVRVVIFSTSLSDVAATVEQVRARSLAAGTLALIVAVLIGILAANPIARRIRRLEAASRVVAAGNFSEPIEIDSRDELGALAGAFNEMQVKLASLDRSRKAFIANASHELRTPLFSLGGYVELMEEEDLDEATYREFLATIRAQIDRLTKLATDLLDLSKIDTGSLDMRPERFNVGSLIQSITAEFAGVLAQHESPVEIAIAADDLEAYCDPDRVAQVLRILLDNAMIHTPPSTAITVGARREGRDVMISVADDGPGIAAADIERIFERFHTGKRHGGTGLGLSIARDLVTAMGSRLEVRSRPGETVFEIALPAVASSYPTSERA